MHPSFALLAVTAACVLARPPDPVRVSSQHTPSPDGDGIVRRLILPRYYATDSRPPIPQPPFPLQPYDYDSRYDWLTKEIDKLNVMNFRDDTDRLTSDERFEAFEDNRFAEPKRTEDLKGFEANAATTDSSDSAPLSTPWILKPMNAATNSNKSQPEKMFAFTPLDDGFYDVDFPRSERLTGGLEDDPFIYVMHRRSSETNTMANRMTRQNPNLSKNKLLVAENLEKLKSAVPLDENDTQTDNAKHLHGDYQGDDPASSMYGVALVAAVGAAMTVAVFGFAFGWYTISRKAKAAADVDYPGYGVTGPTVECTGDRKLAHSAHMYHYQHQKQQILAMERNGMEQRIGSMSDPESEEENEEGDYTVYECPGFATTGDMEVKNPLFSDEPTPATPAQSDSAKPQPKDANAQSKE